MADRAKKKSELGDGRPPIHKIQGLVEADDSQKLVHERVRLAIVSALAVNASLTFTELRELLGITDGNLSVHARRLEDGGLVKCAKSFEGRTPKTEFSLTAKGRRALQRYLDHMESLIRSVRESE